MRQTILLVDSTHSTADELRQSLEDKGYDVKLAHSGKMAFRHAVQEHPNLVILDTTSSRFNGRRLCAALYQKVDAPIIAIIAKKTAPLECADENVVSPADHRKLIVMVRRILSARQPWIINLSELVLDMKQRTVTRNGRSPKKLRPMEARLLKVFMKRPNRVVTRAELMKLVWDTDFTGDTRTLDVHIRWVRERIEENPSKPKLLKTVRGQGYRLEA
ncbi:MAG: response regulator transcription factor [Chloroflexi bacterium]|nr:response regulator transcription factor [Chloroflexota bacterium]MBI3734399.1 response regulator transcription factor [Chloroflexota bacterium]